MEFKISARQSKMWSRIGARASFGQAILDLANNNDNMMAISADLGRSSGFGPLISKHPNKFVNAGIAEQNMVGVAAGFAKLGYTTYATSFAPFLAFRSSEITRMNLSYMEIPVNIVGLASGLALNFLGNSHFGLEDITVFRSFPNVSIFSPCDCAEIFKIIELTSKLNKPTYIRLNGGVNYPVVYEEDYKLEYGKINIINKFGNDVHIYATGSMVYHCKIASEILKDEGINCSVFNVHTIQPFDEEFLKNNLNVNPKLIITAEEHFVSGGLGSLLLEKLNDLGFNKNVLRIGLPNEYLESGEYEYLLEKYNLNSESIVKKIKSEFYDKS